MRRTQAATQPINIAPPSSAEQYSVPSTSDDEDLNHIDGRRHHDRDSHHLNSNFNTLTVGSLPSIRRERRFMVSSGNHEFYSNGQRSPHNNTAYRGTRRDAGSGGGGGGVIVGSLGTGRGFNSHFSFQQQQRQQQQRRHLSSRQTLDNSGDIMMARSMPVPAAPFLASRNDQASGERLSR